MSELSESRDASTAKRRECRTTRLARKSKVTRIDGKRCTLFAGRPRSLPWGPLRLWNPQLLGSRAWRGWVPAQGPVLAPPRLESPARLPVLARWLRRRPARFGGSVWRRARLLLKPQGRPWRHAGGTP